MQDNPFACYSFESTAGSFADQKSGGGESCRATRHELDKPCSSTKKATRAVVIDESPVLPIRTNCVNKPNKRVEESPILILEGDEDIGNATEVTSSAATPSHNEGNVPCCSKSRYNPSWMESAPVVEKKEENKTDEFCAKAKAFNTIASISSTSQSANPQSNKPKRKYRQAREHSDGAVEILCFACRRNPSRKVQKSMACFFKAKSTSSIPLCSRCRQPLKRPAKVKHGATPLTRCPFVKRLEGYKKMAADNDLPYDVSDSKALAIMRMPCSLCGEKAGVNGGGLTRLRVWPARHEGARNGRGKQFMGPFCEENLAPACGMCNLMKGPRKPHQFVEAARHIATHRAASLRRHGLSSTSPPNPGAPLELFGFYPHRFRNNISKRSRSNYITMSTTHTKTHSMTNEEFNRITAGPCHYCGKEPQPDADPPHFNGLDRLDSDERIYSAATVVACCGDCNVMKYTHSEEVFLQHCLKVARFNAGVDYGDLEE